MLKLFFTILIILSCNRLYTCHLFQPMNGNICNLSSGKCEKRMTVTEFVNICSVLNIATETVKSTQNCFLYMSKIFLTFAFAKM